MKYYIIFEYHNPSEGCWEQRCDEYDSYEGAIKCVELIKDKSYIRYVAGPLIELNTKN